MTKTLDPNRWKQVESLFYAALELEPPARVAFVRNQSPSDPELLDEVISLLASVTGSDGFLAQPLSRVVQEVGREFAGERSLDPLHEGGTFNHYEIGAKIGAGGMGQVYKAMDTVLRRPVALKVLAPYLTCDESAFRRFQQEAHAASALNHPNILTIFEFGQVDSLHYIASELIEGLTLRQTLQSGRLEVKTAVGISLQLASALAEAHALGIIHRDIKPENILVRGDGLVKLVDFGIAKLGEAPCSEGAGAPQAFGDAGQTQPGTVMGTLRYMSPEQVRQLPVDGRSDLFSVGAVLYEMLAGTAAFDGENREEILHRIVTVDPPSLSEFGIEVPFELELIVAKALRKEREARYQTARDLHVDLQQFQKKLEFEANLIRAGLTPSGNLRPRPLGETASGGHTRLAAAAHPARLVAAQQRFPAGWPRRWLVAVGASVVLLLVATVFFVFWRAAHPPAPDPVRSLAILPFRNLNRDAAADFLEVSLADALIAKLSELKSLNVRPASSVNRFRGTDPNLQEVARQLHAELLLTGTFQKQGGNLQIGTQLIDAKASAVLWRRTMTLPYDQLLTVQDRLSQQVVEGLALKLSPSEAQRLKQDRPENTLAYEYYLRGVDLYSLNDFDQAIDELHKSIALDPDYALAWAQLGRAYTTHASLQFGGREQYARAKDAYAKALSIDPGLVDVRIYMANLLTDTGRVEEAVPLLKEALDNNPNSAEAHWELGYAYRFGGMLDASVAEAEQARRLDPEVKMNSSAINAYLYRGEYRKFLDSLPLSNSGYTLFYRGLAQYYLKDFSQAEAEFDRAYAQDRTTLPAPIGQALSDGLKHRSADGLKLLRETEDRFDRQGVSDPEMLYKLAQAYAVLGDSASALRALERSAEGGFFCAPYLAKDPIMDSLRGNPKFCELAGRIDARHRQFLARFAVKTAAGN